MPKTGTKQRARVVMLATAVLVASGSGAALGSEDESARPSDLPRDLQEECWIHSVPGGGDAPCSLALPLGGSGGQPARALLVRERQGKRRRGIAIQLGEDGVVVAGAGRITGRLGRDLAGVGFWTVLVPRDRGLDGDILLLGPAAITRGRRLSRSVVLALRGEDTEIASLYHVDDELPPFETLDVTDPRRRFVALGLLHEYQVGPVKDRLLPGLRDPDQAVRLAVASALAASKVTEAASAIAAWLRPGHPGVSPFTLAEIATCLGELGVPETVPRLGRAVNDADPKVRISVVQALGRIGGDQAALLIASRSHDRDEGVRLAALDALGHVGGDIAVAVLQGALSDRDRQVRRSAAAAGGKLKTDSIVPALITALDDDDGEVQLKAAAALGSLKSREAVPALIELLQRAKPYKEERHGMCFSPSLLQDPACVAAYALTKIGDPAGIAAAKEKIEQCNRRR